VFLAAFVGIVVTSAALFGSVYKVQPPTIYAAYAAIGTLVLGAALTFAFPGRASASTEFGELTASERGPVKL
jgi:hypothetical protein